jgi:hypothetical protein
MKKIESYQAFDGTLFENEDECVDYENNALIRIAETVKCVCDLRDGCVDSSGSCPFLKSGDSDDNGLLGSCMFEMNYRAPNHFIF